MSRSEDCYTCKDNVESRDAGTFALETKNEGRVTRTICFACMTEILEYYATKESKTEPESLLDLMRNISG